MPRKQSRPITWLVIGFTALTCYCVEKAEDRADKANPKANLELAKDIASTHPQIEVVGQDEAGETVTFRDMKTGEEFTFSYQELEEGKVAFTSNEPPASPTFGVQGGGATVTNDEGEVRLGSKVKIEDFPAWVPVYPNAKPSPNAFSDTAKTLTGSYSFRTEDILKKVVDYYVAHIEEAGLEIRTNTTTPSGAMVFANTPDRVRGISLNATTKDGTVNGFFSFHEKKQAP